MGYIRVSGAGQIEKDGPKRQREAITSFCQRVGVSCVQEYFDKGESGTVEALDRPAFVEMLTDIERINEEATKTRCESLRVAGVVIERTSRMARDLMVQELLLRELRKRNLKLFSTDVGTLDDVASNAVDPTRKMLRQIMGAIDEWECAVTVIKLRIARQRIKRQTGKCEGRKSYGFRAGEMEIRDQILQWRNNDKCSYWEIAKRLNNSKKVTRAGRRWTPGTAYSVINYWEKINKQKGNIQCVEVIHTS